MWAGENTPSAWAVPKEMRMDSGQTDRREFLRQTLALPGVLLGSQRRLLSHPAGGGRTFAEVRGPDRVQELLEDAFSVYGGRQDGNTLAKLMVTSAAGAKYFVNDNVWWRYIDFQCNYHATYGWRPFFDKSYRQVDCRTWQACFRYQVTDALQEYFRRVEQAPRIPPLNWLPGSFDPYGENPYPFDANAEHPKVYSVMWYYANTFVDPKAKRMKTPDAATHAEGTDYPLQNCISATDYLLWERDTAMARVYLPKMDAFLEAMLKQFQDASGLLRVGTQGSQIEFCHHGFRYPGHTHVYLLKVYRNMQEAARMAGRHDLAEKYGRRAQALRQKMAVFTEGGKWFVGGLKDAEGQGRLGTGRLDGSPSSYFEVWHNVNAVVLHVAEEEMSRTIVEKIASIPALTANHLTLINYPARPRDESDPNHPAADGKPFPLPGAHVNGGWFWMCAAGALYAYTRTGRADLWDRLTELLSDHHHHYSIDYYNQYGANKGRQWPERGHDTYSVTCAGSFGMLFRALLGLQVSAECLEASPSIPLDCARLKTRAPVYYAGKRVYFDIRNGAGPIRHVSLNGKAYRQHTEQQVSLPYRILEADNMIEIERQS
jgi:hypothetical protein